MSAGSGAGEAGAASETAGTGKGHGAGRASWKARLVNEAVGAVVQATRNVAAPVSTAQDELHDPTPQLHSMFLKYNKQFFFGSLSHIEVKWSKRMTRCAGLCVYESGGLCSVRLSAPLLKYRPRSDFVNTLLHEMIHAYLFITVGNVDREGHGKPFLDIMNHINKIAGTSISVYHTFHDEVDQYLTHVWRCTGPCREQKPYFGYCKRSMNRAPSHRDSWWSRHQATCGGTWEKVSEPAEYTAKQLAKAERKKKAAERKKQAAERKRLAAEKKRKRASGFLQQPGSNKKMRVGEPGKDQMKLDGIVTGKPHEPKPQPAVAVEAVDLTKPVHTQGRIDALFGAPAESPSRAGSSGIDLTSPESATRPTLQRPRPSPPAHVGVEVDDLLFCPTCATPCATLPQLHLHLDGCLS